MMDISPGETRHMTFDHLGRVIPHSAARIDLEDAVALIPAGTIAGMIWTALVKAHGEETATVIVACMSREVMS